MDKNSDRNNLGKNEEIKSNLKSIKSSYNLEQIFSFLNMKRKLNIIIYNKYMQKVLKYDIGDYRTISGKYKEGGKNGEGCEYILHTKKLLFKGEYLNGKRNGKGKEYRYNKLNFEGEYLNGERNGKGKEYYDNDKLLFEGEYLNGKRWNGKGYNYNNELEFEIKDGKGRIKEYNENGKLIFDGEYLNGERNGKGKEYYNKN